MAAIHIPSRKFILMTAIYLNCWLRENDTRDVIIISPRDR